MESLEAMENGVRLCNGGMAMESLEVVPNGVDCGNGGSVQLSNGVEESDTLDVDILEDLDSYMQDVNDRLTISRMVSDSVVKGMVKAVKEEAAEEIAQKDQEVIQLKQMLHIYHVGVDENQFLGSSVMLQESTGTQRRLNYIGSGDRTLQPCSLEAVSGHDIIAETLVHLRGTTNEEFKKLKKEIDSIRGRNLIKRISSSFGLGDVLQDKVADRWDVDRTLDSLKTTVESVYQQVEEMVCLSKSSVYEWQLEQDLRTKIEADIEALVIRNCIWSVEGKMWTYGAKNVDCDGRMKRISGIRDELDAIARSLSVSDNGQQSSHGSLEGKEESSNGLKGASTHRRILNNLISSTSLPSTITTAASSFSSHWEENGIHEELEINMEEHLDPGLLKHMSKEELISHCTNEITKLKRNHELKIQNMTEQHFSHMRELLKERGPSLTVKKNKEFDMLRNRISEVLSKVDEILAEKEEVTSLFPQTFGGCEESISSLKDKVDSLFSENHQLRHLLEDKKREIKCLSLQLSEAAENLSKHTVAEANLFKTVENLKAGMEDAHIEALIGEDLFASIVKEVVDEIKCAAEESWVENSIVHEIYKSILEEAIHDAKPSTTCELEDLNMESIIMQELCDVIFRDALKEAEEKLNDLNFKYINEYKLRVLHEIEKQDKEKQLIAEVANKERLQQEVLCMVEEKEQLARDTAAALAYERERYELAAQEVENLRVETCQHQKLISESVEVSKAAKRDLVEALGQNDRQKTDISKLEQKLEVAVKELRQVEEDRRILLDVNQEKQIAVSLFEAKEKEFMKQFESLAVHVSDLLKSFTDFECRVTQDISGKCSRLRSLTSQSQLLEQKADVIVRRGFLYKQRFEKKCSDLEKAESEVDLLGDEVDTLLNLVEKIYIALDHYSPILKHYPGIIEILKLVKRELCAESRSV
ncbi:WPP domain-associated protein [Argentina anserina]|uniref:WPP domain-associated protein n=1 Tax=Argentina anserina TaxID=57926 RepID=UPI0021767BCF|nr:WPP domain-associated protein [Potentilla anserina]XP_050369438.1 WPP domain-associated protein [Potentilla anserina]XP_050369439.1 WPP domain-associated protein [Potentilla anserina]